MNDTVLACFFKGHSAAGSSSDALRLLVIHVVTDEGVVFEHLP